MKKDLKEFIKSAKKWKKSTQILFALIFFMAASFGAISLLGVVAVSDWYFNHRTSQAITRQSEIQNSKTAPFETMADKQEATTENMIDTKQQTVSVNSVQNKSSDNVSEADQKEIDRINEQIKELEDAKNNSNYQAPKAAEITPLEIKPITVPDIDTTITTQPIDGTIKPTGRPADVCASSAAKFLPECK